MKSVVLDTNAYSLFLQGNRRLGEVIFTADTVYLSVVVLGELLYGFIGGTKEKQNLTYLEKFLNNEKVKVIDVTSKTAEIYADIKHRLRLKGTPIPLNDIWIAAHTIETGSTLITFDNHFSKIPKLRLWRA